jgi:hypothetical protein
MTQDCDVNMDDPQSRHDGRETDQDPTDPTVMWYFITV